MNRGLTAERIADATECPIKIKATLFMGLKDHIDVELTPQELLEFGKNPDKQRSYLEIYLKGLSETRLSDITINSKIPLE